MASISLSGLASGVDTSGIIEQLMALDRRQITTIQNSQTRLTAHQSALNAVAAKLNAFNAAALDLNEPKSWKATQSLASSDPAKVGVTLLGGAGIGGHTIQVDRLASSAQQGFTYTKGTTAGAITLSYDSDPAAQTTINVAANATAADVATAINASEGAPVYAAVVKDADGFDRLVLSARKSGEHSDFTADFSGLTGGGAAAADPAYLRTGSALNALYRVDGEATARESESNVVDSAVPGLRITLKGVTTSPASVSTTVASIDKESIKAKAKTFVDAYNALVDLTRTDIAEKGVSLGKATTTAELQKGTLFGDLGLNSMLSSLRNKLQETVSGIGALSGLADIGITMAKSTGVVSSEDAKAGKLVFDPAVMEGALDTDWTQVRSLFSGAGVTKGFSAMIGDYVKAQTGTSGILSGRVKSDATLLTDTAKRIVSTNLRLDAQEKRLKSQFAAMETAMANAQSQQAWLTGQISSLR